LNAVAAGVGDKLPPVRLTYGQRMHPNDRRVVSNFIVQALGLASLELEDAKSGRQSSMTGHFPQSTAGFAGSVSVLKSFTKH
jgi:hypothetical protein